MMALENLIAQTTDSKGREKMKVVQKGTGSFLDGHSMSQDEYFEVTTWRSSCWRLILFVLPYCYDISKGLDMSIVHHGTTVDRPCIECLVLREAFWSMNWAVIQSIAITWSAR